MIDHVDLLIAVIGIAVSVLGSSAALRVTLSKKADQEDVARLEDRMDRRFERMETRFDGLEDGFHRLEGRFDGWRGSSTGWRGSSAS